MPKHPCTTKGLAKNTQKIDLYNITRNLTSHGLWLVKGQDFLNRSGPAYHRAFIATSDIVPLECSYLISYCFDNGVVHIHHERTQVVIAKQGIIEVHTTMPVAHQNHLLKG